MTAAAQTAAAPSHHYWLRIGLMAVAGLELMDSAASVGGIFSSQDYADAMLRFAQTLLNVKLALAPIAAVAGLFFAAFGRLRAAVLSLAAFALMGWMLNDLWTGVIHGFGFNPGYYSGAVGVFAHQVVFPLGTFAGIVLALTTRHLAWAGLLVSLPPLYNWAGVLLFAVSILLRGF